MQFWHGGNLDNYDDFINHRPGRYEYGPGLYLISDYNIAKKYAKGSRKLYLITVDKGQEIGDCLLDIDDVKNFANLYCKKHKIKELLSDLEKWQKDQKVPADIFNNLIINLEMLRSAANSINLRKFYVDNGIDYSIVDNAFGSGADMLVLFNMKKIKEAKRITHKDKIEKFNLKESFDLIVKKYNING